MDGQEREMLSAAPFSREQLVLYRLSSIVKAAAVKALCFALVMIPDLRIWPLGFIGMLLGLIFLDLLRMAVEVVAWGVTRITFLKIRAAVLTVAAAAVGGGIVMALCRPARIRWIDRSLSRWRSDSSSPSAS